MIDIAIVLFWIMVIYQAWLAVKRLIVYMNRNLWYIPPIM